MSSTVEPSRLRSFAMAKHEIRMSMPAQEVVNADVSIRVKSDDASLGRIEISKGSIDWWPANNSKTHYRMSWEAFQRVMEQHGREVKKK